MRVFFLFLVATLTGWYLSSVSPIISSASSDYKLPIAAGQSIYVTQGNDEGDHISKFLSEYAFDFSNDGRPFTVVAARGGTVIGLRSNSDIQCRGLDTLINGQKLNGCWTRANFVLIQHGDGTSDLYMHLAKDTVMVHRGETVQGGQPIATAGTTGWSTGIHLHFQRELTPTRSVQNQNPNTGWWWKNSVPVHFSDKSILQKNANGIPQSFDQCNPQSEPSKNGCNLYTSDNSAPARLPIALPTPNFSAPTISAPSASLVIPTLTPQPHPQGYIAYVGADGNIWEIHADGTGRKLLVHSPGTIKSMAWSRNGQILAFVTYDPGTGVYLLDVKTKQVREVHTSSPVAGPIAFFPSGERLVALSAARKDIEFFCFDQFVSIDTQTGNVSHLVKGGCRPETLQVTPDGKSLVITTNQGDPSTSIMRVSISTGKFIFIVAPGWELGPRPGPVSAALSTDGRKLAYALYRPKSETLVVANSDGSKPFVVHRFQTDSLDDSPLTLAPNDAQIAFTQSKSIWVIGTNGAGLHQIAQGSLPTWQPLSKAIP